MLSEGELSRRAEALKGIYKARGVQLSEDEARAIATQKGRKPFVSFVVCVMIIVALIAFLIVRFA
jgi:hypothetical protein